MATKSAKIVLLAEHADECPVAISEGTFIKLIRTYALNVVHADVCPVEAIHPE